MHWLFPDSLGKHIAGFQVYRSDVQQGPYDVISPKILPRTSRMFLDSLAQIQNYYKVAAIDWMGKPTFSIEEFVQFEDTIPPVSPKILSHSVHKNTGVVSLRWRANEEKDLAGYSVFMGNSPHAEFSQLTKSLSKDTVFRDTLALNVLNKKVYYVVRAYDKHLNASPVLDTIVVKRPDIIPPASPNFTQAVATDSSIFLAWANSASADVVSTFVLRREFPTGQPCLLYAFSPAMNVHSLVDTTALEKQEYEYSLVAIDEAGLLSEPVLMRKERMMAWLAKPIAPLTFVYEKEQKMIHIQWPQPTKAVKKYLLYRQVKEEKMTLYKYFDGKFGFYTEGDVKVNTPYKYRLMAIFADDSESQMSPIFEAILLDK